MPAAVAELLPYVTLGVWPSFWRDSFTRGVIRNIVVSFQQKLDSSSVIIEREIAAPERRDTDSSEKKRC